MFLVILYFTTTAYPLCTIRMCHNIPRPSLLPGKACYYIFKEQIQPAWEDEHNVGGGKIIITLSSPAMRANGETLYFDLLLLIIGNQLPSADHVCGTIYQKAKDCIEIWADKQAKTREMQDSIISILNEILTLKSQVFKLEKKDVAYRPHMKYDNK